MPVEQRKKGISVKEVFFHLTPNSQFKNDNR